MAIHAIITDTFNTVTGYSVYYELLVERVMTSILASTGEIKV